MKQYVKNKPIYCKHDNMRSQMEKQMRLIKEMQVKLDVRESEQIDTSKSSQK